VRYLLAVQAPVYPIDSNRFATESAFAIHLKSISRALEPQFDCLVLLAPVLTREAYDRSKSSLTELSAIDDSIAHMPVPEAGMSIVDFWKNAWPLWRRLRSTVKTVGFVHSGMSADTWRPFLAMLNLAAWVERRPSLFAIDIDFRKLSRRSYELGTWSRKSYLFNRVFHDVAKRFQVWFAIRTSDLVLLKSTSMVSDLGGGRENVRFFLDAAHGDDDVISAAQLEQRLARFNTRDRDLRVVYFGRLVPYKGCDLMLEAIAAARARGAGVTLTLIGDGESREELRSQADRLGLAGAVTFMPSVRYGPALFDLVDQADIAIAAPKIEDTPRAALDAMARGLPLVAFDIDYFKTLAETSGAVLLASWPKSASLAEQLQHLDSDRSRIVEMSRKAVVFARANTQDIWLRRRVAWTFDALRRRDRQAQP